MNWRFIPYKAGEPAWNMAVDEAIFHFYQKGLVPPTLRFYGWDPPALSLGYFQSIDKDVVLDTLKQNGYGLVRRNTGGRAVFHDRELTYSVVAGVQDGLPQSLLETYLYISRAIVEACHSLGVQAELHKGFEKGRTSGACFESSSWYELSVDGRKLVGSAQLRKKGSFLQHGSILIDFSAESLGAILKVPVSLDEWVIKINSKVTSFKDQGIFIKPDELSEKIIISFRQLYNLTIIESTLSPAELILARQLVHQKYASDDWNLRRNHEMKLI
ncbi:MAG TPA: octanoyltransferase [Firmicutes bacterium]|nr:octanoyltransferase [Bacillota bacterium]